MAKYFRIGIVLGFILAALLLWAISFANNYLQGWSANPRFIGTPTIFEFARGTSLRTLSQSLAEKKLIDHAYLFEFWVRRFDDYSKYQAGTYQFEGNISPGDISNKLRSGEIYEPVVLQFTIPEGFTLHQIIERLSAQGVCSLEECKLLSRDQKFINELKLDSPDLEGFLYPATYRFTQFPDAKAAFSKMVSTFWKRLPGDYMSMAEEKGLTLRQAVTFASLIELETSDDSERELVSEVIWNRLNQGIALAIDAAIIYGIEGYQGDITWKHLRDESNPYNTRIHKGLPPGPIGSPSRKSLLAVFNPSQFGYMYYVLDVETDGKHHFSKSLQEHNQYVKKLVKFKRRTNPAAE